MKLFCSTLLFLCITQLVAQNAISDGAKDSWTDDRSWSWTIDDKAYVVYFTHPGRISIMREEQLEDSYRFRKSVLQIAELKIEGTKMICKWNKYAVK